jgi:hypothetical protein
VRFYLVPVVGTGFSGDRRRPKYFATDAGLPAIADSAGAQFMDYGDEPVMLVCANTTGAEHAAIVANADVASAPLDLTQTIGANLGTVQARLEAFHIPADWITAGMTYKTTLRWVTRLFFLHQRFQGLKGGRFFPSGITLDSQVGDLTAAQRQKFQAAIASLNLDAGGVTLTTTIRAALKQLADQLPGWSMGGAL